LSDRFKSPFSRTPINRRDFLRQTFAFSAMAALAPGSILAQQGTKDSPAPDPGAQHMFMLGDWGTNKYIGQQIAVAAGMRKMVDDRHIHPGALFMLGDNWYGTLLGGVNSPRWQTQFEQMYPVSHFPGPAYAVLGNHDYEFKIALKAQTQLDYAAQIKGTRWKMPARWYTFAYPEQNPIVTFICLDTNLPRSKEGLFLLPVTMSKAERDEQDAWFRAELAKPRTTPFVIVTGHHPLYTNGIHKDNQRLIRDWDILLRGHKVDFYITGHDHDLQHLEFAGHPTSFVISGGGGAELVDFTISPEKRGPFGAKVLGFTDLEMKPDAIILRHFNQDAKELHAFRKTPDGKVEILRTAAS
jgi:tartrate-resistant acid phosphatase type 5